MSALEDQVQAYVEAHPGCLRRDIVEGLAFEGNPHRITHILGHLRREYIVISKTPPTGIKAQTRWYPSRLSLFSEGYS